MSHALIFSSPFTRAKGLVAIAAASAALAVAAPASAATLFNFGGGLGTLNTLGTDTYTLTVSGITVNVKGYSSNASSVDLSNQADVNVNAGGLGVTGHGDDDINSGGLGIPVIAPLFGEGLLLTFSQTVDLSQAIFTDFNDNILNILFPDNAELGGGSGTPLAPLTVVAGTWNGSKVGTQFYIGATSTDSSEGDSFRLKSVSVTAVPEPTTWTMMILGLGLVGYGLRRRRHSTSVRFDLA